MHDPSVNAIPFPEPTPVRDLRLTVPAAPRPLTSFVGRAREVEAVCDLFRSGPARLVTLTGPGGVGKTRLAIRIAFELEAELPNGVGFIPLASIRDASQVGAGIARAFQVDQTFDIGEEGPLPPPLRGFRGFVILDNFEHVIAAATVVSRLLAGSPGMRILVTSRQPLNVTGERVFPVSPLPLPESGGDDDAMPLPAAVQLFLDRAVARNPGIMLASEDIESVAGICRALDGLPLAIELAAAHVTTVSPAELLRRMERRLSLLARNTIDAPPRHRTMRDAIDWSHELLDDRLRAAFRRLSVFVGGFTIEAAGIVLNGGGDVLEILEDLVARSLILAQPGFEGETRFHMLEVVREFGLEHLTAGGEEPEVRRLHADWARQVAERSQWSWFMPFDTGGALLAELEREFSNIREALRWHEASGDVEAGLGLAGILGGLWCVLGHGNEGLRWLAPAEDTEAPIEAATRAKALATLSWVTNKMGDAVGGLELARKSLRLAEEVDRPIDRIYGLVLAGVAARSIGEPGYAEACHLEVIDRLTAMESVPWAQNCITTVKIEMGMMYFFRGDLDRAEALFREVVERQTAAGAEIGSSHVYGTHVLTCLGDVARGRGDQELALHHYRQALELAWRFHDTRTVCFCLGGIGGSLAGMGDYLMAARFLGASEACHARFGYRFEYETMSRQRALGLPEPWARESEPCPPADALRSALRERYPYRPAWIEIGEAMAESWVGGGDMEIADALAVEPPRRQVVPKHGLTARELDVLRLLVDGKTDREIADELFISRRTAATHVRHIYSKLGVSSRAEAAVWAVRNEVT